MTPAGIVGSILFAITEVPELNSIPTGSWSVPESIVFPLGFTHCRALIRLAIIYGVLLFNGYLFSYFP